MIEPHLDILIHLMNALPSEPQDSAAVAGRRARVPWHGNPPTRGGADRICRQTSPGNSTTEVLPKVARDNSSQNHVSGRRSIDLGNRANATRVDAAFRPRFAAGTATATGRNCAG